MSLPSPAEIASALIAREEMPPEKGDIGPQGMDGKAGEFGPPGPQGAKGDPGRNGTNGTNGNVGPKGPQGNGGPRGPKGEKGDKGDEGERGPIGPMGPTGAVGSGKALFPRPGGGSGGSQIAIQVPFTPAGTIAATNVQAAIEEVAAEAGSGTQDIAEVLTEGSVAETGQAIFWRNLADNADIQMLRVFGTEFTTDPGTFYDTQQVGRDIIIDDFFTGQINIFDKAIAFYGTPASGYPHIFDGGVEDPEAAINYPYTVVQRTSVVVNGADGIRTSQIDLTGFAATGVSSSRVALRVDGGVVIFDLVGLPTADPAVTGQVWNATGNPVLSGATLQTYAASNVTTDRTFNANSTTVDELADVLGTLIADLRAKGLVA